MSEIENLNNQLNYYIFSAPPSECNPEKIQTIVMQLKQLGVSKNALGLTVQQFEARYGDILSWSAKQSTTKRTYKYAAALSIILAILIAGFINQHLYVSATKMGYVRMEGDDVLFYGFYPFEQTVAVPASILEQSVPITIDTFLSNNYINLRLPLELLQDPELYQLSSLHTKDGYIISLETKDLTMHAQKTLCLPWELPEDAILQEVNSATWDNSEIYLSGNTIYAKIGNRKWTYYITSTLILDDFVDLINNFRPFNLLGAVPDYFIDVTFDDIKSQRYKDLYLPVHLLDNPNKYDYKLRVQEGVLNNLMAIHSDPETGRFLNFYINDKYGIHRFEFIGDRVDWPETQPPYYYLRAMYNVKESYFHVSFVVESYFYLIITNYPEEELKEIIRTMVLLD